MPGVSSKFGQERATNRLTGKRVSDLYEKLNITPLTSTTTRKQPSEFLKCPSLTVCTLSKLRPRNASFAHNHKLFGQDFRSNITIEKIPCRKLYTLKKIYFFFNFYTEEIKNESCLWISLSQCITVYKLHSAFLNNHV